MCLLCVMEPGATPTRDQLANSADSNPHGYGYAFMTHDRIITGRGMDADEMIDRFLHLRSGMPDAWAMWHARYTTHGDTTKSNCHPFRVDGNDKIVLGHNGILPIDVPKGDKRSDTRIFAEEYLPDLGVEVLDDAEWRAYLAQWMGGSKVAIFSIDPRLEANVYILNENAGHWADGIWWSNDSYKDNWYDRYIKKSRNRWSMWGLDNDETPASSEDELQKFWFDENCCNLCLHELSDTEMTYEYCGSCMMCLECYDDLDACMCYRPREVRFDMPDVQQQVSKVLGQRAAVQSLLPYSQELQ